MIRALILAFARVWHRLTAKPAAPFESEFDLFDEGEGSL